MGLQYRLPQNWSVDLSYRYLDMDVNGSQHELDDTQQITLAVDRRFLALRQSLFAAPELFE